jgi:type VII secretion integral membrane protein EccD
MTTRFTRLSIVSGEEQLDLSLPATRPVAEYLSDLPAMFSISSQPTPDEWALSASRHGELRADLSLDDAGVLDGDLLYLTARAAAPRPPIIDDALAAITTTVDAAAPVWEGRARDWATSALLAGLVVPLTAAMVTLRSASASGVLLVAGFVLTAVAARMLSSRGGVLLAWTGLACVPAAAGRMLAAHALGAGVQLVGVAAATLLGLLVVGWSARLPPAVAGSGVVTGALLGAADLITAAGVRGSSLAAWASIGLVILLAVIPHVSLGASGLLRVVRDAEAGAGGVSGTVLDRTIATTRTTLDTLAVSVGTVAASAVTTLIVAGRPAQAWLGGLVAAIFLLRSRGFSQVLHVGFVLVVPLAGAVAAAFAAPRWIGVASSPNSAAVTAVGVLAVIFVTASAGYLRLPEVPAARLSRLLDQVEVLAVVALIPLVLVAQDVFGRLAHRL